MKEIRLPRSSSFVNEGTIVTKRFCKDYLRNGEKWMVTFVQCELSKGSWERTETLRVLCIASNKNWEKRAGICWSDLLSLKAKRDFTKLKSWRLGIRDDLEW